MQPLRDPDPALFNADIAPTSPAERHWSVLNLASLWVGMVVCVPTYMLAGGLVGEGMSWWQAVLTIALGNLIVLVPMVLNGHGGTKYGVPFPVLARAAFGIHGAHVPSVLRGLVACGWFGIQTWFGGFAIYQILNIATSGALQGADLPVLGISGGELGCFVLFWALQVALIVFGVESIRWLETLAAPFLIGIGLALLAWAWFAVGGFGPMLSAPSQFGPGGPREGQFFTVFFPSLTAMVGFWATLSLNIPDFTRYARSQRDQVLGQALGLPPTMALFAFISVAVTSATVVVFGEAIPDPTVLAGKLGGGLTVAIALLALVVATLTTNIAANVVSPANALINLAPGRVTFVTGGLITAALGLLAPWKLVEDTEGYIFTWLVGYSALLGPIGGILVADYFVWRRTRLDLDALYHKHGPYWYAGGFNPAAMVALLASVLPNLPGFLHQAGLLADGYPGAGLFDAVYPYAWFVGFGLAAGLYLALMAALAPTPAGRTAPATETR
ncbi:MAG: NCS1 family nucleobase:cation symporter-1 [Bryobacterales bacterium]